jgi:hypothetical protein
MADERPNLRVVGGDERMPDKTGSLGVVIEDLEVAHGHVVEATAEAAECPEDTEQLVDALFVAEAAVTKALRAAHEARHPAGP